MHLAECVSAATCSGVRVSWSLASTGAAVIPLPPSRSSLAHSTASCLQARCSSLVDISWSSTLEASEPLRMRHRASFLNFPTAERRSTVLSSTTARQKFSCFTRSMLPPVPAPLVSSLELCKFKRRNSLQPPYVLQQEMINLLQLKHVPAEWVKSYCSNPK
jgi:hypothetical protein